MMTTPKRCLGFALFLGSAWLIGAGCGASQDAPDGIGAGGTGAGGSGLGGSSAGQTVVDPGGTSSTGGAGRLNPLCGVLDTSGTCLPDAPRACQDYKPPSDGGAGAGGGAGEANGGQPSGGEPGSAGATSGGAPSGGGGAGGEGEGGALGGGGESGSSGAAGGGGEGGDAPILRPIPAYGCQVSRVNNQPYRSCTAAGVGQTNAPCFTAADCAPGLACVTEGEAARCLPYCCDPSTPCGSGSYCADRPLRKAPSDDTEAEPPRVPVCVPADGCSLEDRYPCPSDTDCRCKGDTACMVVRDDGTTTCLQPGSGKQGEACPCAWNHVCSKVTNRCVQICRTDAASNECGEQKCQASSELPGNFGLCVGAP